MHWASDIASANEKIKCIENKQIECHGTDSIEQASSKALLTNKKKPDDKMDEDADEQRQVDCLQDVDAQAYDMIHTNNKNATTASKQLTEACNEA